LNGLFVVIIAIATFGLASAQTEPATKEATESGQTRGQGQVRLVPYKDVGWRTPSSGEVIMAKLKSSFFAQMGLILSRVSKGSMLVRADDVYVINPNDRLPGFNSSLEAGRLAVESLGGTSAVKITSLEDKGFVSIMMSVVLPVGTEFEIEKMHWQDTEFDKGIIALRADGLEWRPRPQSTATATQPAEAAGTQPPIASAASTDTTRKAEGSTADKPSTTLRAPQNFSAEATIAPGALIGTTRKAEGSTADKPSTTLRAYQNFLLLESKDNKGSIVKYVMILREALVTSLMKGATSSFEETAAVAAGQLFAVRSGDPVGKADVVASGNEVLRKATVSRFSRISELVGDMEAPSGWDLPVVAVAWKTF